jgi:beta-glucosidase
MDFKRSDFGAAFKWGASASAYQTEGAWDSDDKGKSGWDVFSNTRRKIYRNQNGNTACDFYHQFPEDLALLSRLNIPNFRFSLSWSRIMPSGSGKVNYAGIDFYNRVIDHCLALGIEPWITLYHWDLPFELEKKGGWANRDIIGWFSEYTDLCTRQLGDRVKYWMILNEPMVFTGAGYYLGVHAPGEKKMKKFLAAVHHAALCQAEGGRVVRSNLPEAIIGTTFSCSLIQPRSQSHHDIMAAIRVDALVNRLFVEPLAGLGYPLSYLNFLNQLDPFIKDGDEGKLAFNMDFIGVQNFTREIVSRSYFMPGVKAKVISAGKRNVPISEMNWEVYPESIYHMLAKFSKYKSFKEIIVTESGIAFPDILHEGKVNDEKRRNYLEQCIGQVLKSRRDGVNVNGYFVWSLTDNFEWAEGYRPRFGLIYVDFGTRQRIIKESGYWYGRLLGNE